MTGLQIPSPTPNPAPLPEPPAWEPQSAIENADFSPVLLAQLEDDLARSRFREAFWISVIVHICVVMLLYFSPKLMPRRNPVQLLNAQDLINQRDLTYLQMPKDRQAPTKPPDTKYLSDKNRIAESRTPPIDRKTLEQLRDVMPQGAPGAAGQQSAEATPPAMGAGGGQRQQQQQQAQATNPNPALPVPQPKPTQNLFASALSSAGSSIQEAARDSRGAGTGGNYGDYGLGQSNYGRMGPFDILSDTQGVDFGPYLARVLQTVKMNWYNLIPEEARPPLLKRGKVAIQFVILPDGKVAGLQLVGPSGDIALDRAAWGGITNSNPFSALPSQFHGPYLALRFHFFYNPRKGDME